MRCCEILLSHHFYVLGVRKINFFHSSFRLRCMFPFVTVIFLKFQSHMRLTKSQSLYFLPWLVLLHSKIMFINFSFCYSTVYLAEKTSLEYFTRVRNVSWRGRILYWNQCSIFVYLTKIKGEDKIASSTSRVDVVFYKMTCASCNRIV
jgi:hypothetical protein